MGLRPGKCYSKIKRAYTRKSIKKPRESYAKGVPVPKIPMFEVGSPKQKFDLKLKLITTDKGQIRHNALEAARVAANKALINLLGKEIYFLKILVYPHQILRENPIATGAGADRFQTGMRLSFGKPIATAVRVKTGQAIMEIRISKEREEIGKKALKIASSKLPISCRIAIEQI